MPTVPTDPQFSSQWHLTAIGNITRIWDEYRGGGVRVGVYDDGVERTHTDLDDNYNAALHVVFNGTTFDGNIASSSDAHGTSVAGLIGAEANGSGTVGIAYESDLTGVNIFDPNSQLFINSGTPTGFFAAIAQSVNFDVVNNSWGSTPGYFSDQNGNIANSFTANTLAGWDGAVDNGRGGLGTIVVKSSGNESRNASADGLNGSRFTITVAASSNFDRAASYSNHGSSILVTAPGSEFGAGSLGITTTDRTGTLGYNLRADGAANSDFTDDFGGTSAAGPIVAAVTALMLDANEALGWRDVQNILSYSSTHLGGALDGSAQVTNEDGRWAFNGAENWNGGGLHIHTNYGYGMVDVYNAVRMAEVWSLFGPAQTSTNEQSVTVTDNVPLALPDVVTSTRTFTVAAGLEIEHLALTINITHSFYDDLVLTLIAPDGTRVVLEDRSASDSTNADNGLVWTYGVDHLRGVTSGGVWTLEIFDTAAGDVGTLNSISATFYGTTADANDVYHFTDEFAAAFALDASRRVLTDSDGGVDWINLAAVTGNIVADLTPNGQWTLNGDLYLQTGAGQSFENVVTGDGDDNLIGNSLDNELRGMRGTDQISGNDGNDLLFGGAGNDELFGNTGNDFLDGGVGADFLQGSEGNDSYVVDDAGDVVIEFQDDGTDHVSASINYTLTGDVENLTLIGAALEGYGNSLANTIIGNAGGNYLDGSGGNDVLQGLGGDDLYIVDSSSDRVVETVGLALNDTNDAGGTDQVQAFNTNYSLAGGGGAQFIEQLILFGAGPTNGTGNALDNFIQGSVGNNILDGGAGNDFMTGFGGNDIYILDSLGDTVDESQTESNGIDTVRIGFTYTLGIGVENLELQGSGNINGFGNALANDITGTSGNNRLDGGAGDDTLRGGLGNDTYVVNSGGDVVVEALNGGTDTVETSAATTFMADNVENLLLTGTAQFAFGNALANRMIGTNGSDGLFGGAGVDTLQGLGGDDIYSVDNVNDRVVETLSLAVGATDDAGGVDNVYATVSYSIDTASNVRFVENLTLQDGFGGTPLTTNINGTGNALNNGIVGNNGNNMLDGGLGNDTLTGLLGNDIYLVDVAGDIVVEQASGGTDTVRATFSVAALAAHVENLELQGVANLNGVGNAENNSITGTSGNNRLDGLGGNDVLNGGLGADQMLGGAGDDQYFIDNGSDRVFETVTNNAADTNDAGGVDHITTSITINMNNYNGIRFVENATLTGTADLSLTGNAQANVLTGNNGRNTLDGGTGADILRGGRGDDIYIVDNLSDVTDETGGDGIDLIRSSVTWTLGAAFENLELTGTAFAGLGNALNNRLTGNASDNQLNGGAGSDTLIGGAGNDTYIVDSSGDRIIETITVSQSATNDAGGFDQILSSVSVFMNAYSSISFVESVTLNGSALTSAYGNALANSMFGNDSANTLDGFTGDDFLAGNGGNDTLIGGMGSDTMEGGADRDRLTGGAGQDFLTGGTQADVFAFGVGDMGTSQASADRILDWSGIAGGQGDRIDLSAIDANTANGAGTNEAFAFIGGAAFSNVAGQLRFEVISGNSFLMGDTNGDGVADLFLRLNGVVTVGAGDLAL